MVVEEIPMVTINFHKKQCLPVITWNKKHLSKQFVTITYTREKKFFAVASFKGLELFVFSHSKKSCSILGWYESSLDLEDKTK